MELLFRWWKIIEYGILWGRTSPPHTHKKKGGYKVMSKIINSNLKNNIVKLYSESSLSMIEIASILNVSVTTIQKNLAERNIPSRRETKCMDIERAISMYEQGYHIDDILTTTNTNYCCLYRELDKRNIPRRNNFSTRMYSRKGSSYTKDVIALYQEGKTTAEIALELLISYPTVARIIDKEIKNGTISIHPNDIAQEKENERVKDIAKLYYLLLGNKKITIRQIAKEMDVNENKLYRAIRKSNK